MSSTNKTNNLQLSQFLGTDKPAWLGDYNADMQKIDDAFAALSTGAASSTAEITALQQKDSQIDQDIKDTNDRIDSMATGDLALANRVTTLETNYDTMHHEVAVETQKVNDLDTKVTDLDTKVTDLDTRVTALENAPEGMHAYSSDEKKVGTWIDGRPIYEKSYFNNNVNYAANFNVIDGTLTSANCEALSMDFTCQQAGADWTVAFLNSDIGNVTTQCMPVLNSTGIGVAVGTATITGYSLIFKYVKK